jgi:hypothetical protein
MPTTYVTRGTGLLTNRRPARRRRPVGDGRAELDVAPVGAVFGVRASADVAKLRPLHVEPQAVARRRIAPGTGAEARRPPQFANVFLRKPTAACAALSRARVLPSTVAPTAVQFLSAVVKASPCSRAPVVRSYA